ncbi:MAG: PIG-L deacetylase family protein [Nanoarchaeota archaeon]
MKNQPIILLLIIMCMLPCVSAERILVVHAHQDDETLGLGGKIIQLARAGNNLTFVLLTDGSPEETGDNETYHQIRMLEYKAALAIAGVPEENIVEIGYDDIAFVLELDVEGLLESIGNMTRRINAVHPDQVYFPVYEHGNIDHDTVQYITRRAFENSEVRDTARVYEFVLYNPFALGEPIPEENDTIDNLAYPLEYLEMNETDVYLKKLMITQYKSQDPTGYLCENETIMPAHGNLPWIEIEESAIEPLQYNRFVQKYGHTIPLTEISEYYIERNEWSELLELIELTLEKTYERREGENWTDCELAMLDFWYWDVDKIRALPPYDYMVSPCIHDSCRWTTNLTWGHNFSLVYGIYEETDRLLGITNDPLFRGPGMASREDLIRYFEDIKNGGRDIVAVYGRTAAPSDPTTAFQVGTYLGSIGLDPLRVSISSDQDITEEDYGNSVLLALGGPCANSVAYDIMYTLKGNPGAGCIENFPQDSYLFETVDHGGALHLMIAGWSAEDTIAAGNYVAGLGS